MLMMEKMMGLIGGASWNIKDFGRFSRLNTALHV